MANPLRPVITLNALKASAGLAAIELRSPLKFLNDVDAVAFVTALIEQGALNPSAAAGSHTPTPPPSPPTPTPTVTPPPPTPTPTPTPGFHLSNLIVAPGDSNIHITFDSSEGDVEHFLAELQESGGDWSSLVGIYNGLNSNNTSNGGGNWDHGWGGLTNGVSYDGRVRWDDGATFSDWLTFTVTADPPPTPTPTP